MTFPVFAGNSASTGYNLTRSLRFRASASAYLSRTPATTTNRQTWTWSAWVKRGTLGTSQGIFAASTSGSALAELYFNTSNALSFYDYTGAYNLQLVTTQVFRDPSACYHIVVALDTTNATAANRVKIYVNGAQVTALSTATYPSQNYQGYVNNNIAHYTSSYNGSTDLYDGYLTEVNFIDGQALTPSSFGSTNTLTGVWQPARYAGSYGTNGFYLPFTDNSALTTSSNVGLGKDFSGNGNYWTTNNISITAGVTYDSMTDVPTLTSATAANFCVMNPLDKGSNVAISNGNLTLAPTTTTDCIRATFGLPSSGQWYWEVTVTAIGSGGNIGVATQSSSLSSGGSLTGVLSQYTGYYSINSWSNNGSYTSWTTGDVIAVAVNTGTGAITFYKNGTSLGVIPTTLSSSSVYFPFIQGTSSTYNVNFGQRPFAYTPPTGYVALNTYNIPTSTIVKGNTVMDVNLWAGTGASLNVVNAAGFKPDLVWGKSRSNAYEHALFDSVRGANKQLASNSTAAEVTQTQGLLSFNSNGFTLGTSSDSTVNNAGSGQTYVGWQWQAGQGSSSSNTNGSITSTVSVNASAGFSVVTYTGTGGAPKTVGHGLGVAPSFIVVKQRNAVDNWVCYHSSLGATQYIYLNVTNAAGTASTMWDNTAPTSSVFTLGSNAATNGNGTTMVAYCWTPIAGYSAFGSLTGNGSADGPMVYTGFQPRFLMIKRTDSTADWFLYDTARSTYNVSNLVLFPNSSSAEATGTLSGIDILSNGFKIRGTGADINASGGSYIYMAFATSPFRNSLAR